MMDDERKRAEELLPFYLNGTLDDEERAAVDQILAEDESLREELAFLRAVREDVQSREIPSTPGEFGLARLMRDVDRETAAPETNQPARSNLWKVAAIAAFAAFAAQGVYLATQSGSDFELAGGAGDQIDGTVLTVGFAEGVSEAELRALFFDLEIEIIGGPSALGLYSVVVPEGQSVEAVLDALRGAVDVIESVEVE